MKRRYILALAALLLAATATAQQSQPAQPARSIAAQAAANAAARAAAVDPNGALNAAFQVVQMVDAGRTAELWDSASATTKRLTQKQAFVDGVTKMRGQHGATQARAWIAVRRQQIPAGQDVPAGNYVSVELLAQIAGGKALRELVTFRQDEDGALRFSGYVLE